MAETIFNISICLFFVLTLVWGAILITAYFFRGENWSYRNTKTTLSLIPGFGHLLAGKPIRGLLILAVFSASCVALHFYNLDYPPKDVSNVLHWAVSCFVALSLMVYASYYTYFVAANKLEFGLDDFKEKQLQKVLWDDGTKTQPEQPTPVPEGGFQRKVKGAPSFKPMPPLSDEKSGTPNDER